MAKAAAIDRHPVTLLDRGCLIWTVSAAIMCHTTMISNAGLHRWDLMAID